MTHADLLERHRRLLHSQPECHREVIELGPDPHLRGCTDWVCSACNLVLVIDGLGVIRDRRALRDGRD